MTSRIFVKLLAISAVVILIATLTLDFAIRRSWERSLTAEIERNLREKTLMFAHRVDADRLHPLPDIASQEGQAAGARATVIDMNGKVLADSEANPATMENHATRPEFQGALHGEITTATRKSHTLGIEFVYTAAPIEGGAVRLAYPLSDVDAALSNVRRTLLAASGIAFLLALVGAAAAAQYVTRRVRRIMTFADKLAAGNINARITEPSNDEIGHVASSLDKTARRLEESFAAVQHSQRQLETLLNSMEDAVIAVGADGKVQWANQGMERLAQRVRLNAPLVETVRDPDLLNAVKQAAEVRKVSNARAISIRSGRSFDVTAAPMPEGGVVAVLRDLTERERMEKTRRDFIANVSHELRTPLTSVQGYAETLLDTTPDAEHSREFLEIIRKNAARMSRLTEDLLTLARVESGEQRFDLQRISSTELLRDAAQHFHEVTVAPEITLETKDDAEKDVLADRDAIHHVFGNLLDNAVKYGGAGGRIVLGARSADHSVEFYVRDFGQGIPSEHLPRLFERFYRVDKARSRESGGTGLGLAIAKHIVLAHGGTIRAESELHHGATFVFTLPQAESTRS